MLLSTITYVLKSHRISSVVMITTGFLDCPAPVAIPPLNCGTVACFQLNVRDFSFKSPWQVDYDSPCLSDANLSPLSNPIPFPNPYQQSLDGEEFTENQYR